VLLLCESIEALLERLEHEYLFKIAMASKLRAKYNKEKGSRIVII
jgi:hypothetical protein